MDKFTVDEVNSPKRYINSTAVTQVDRCIDKVFESVNGSSVRTKMQQLKKGNITTQAEVKKFNIQINVRQVFPLASLGRCTVHIYIVAVSAQSNCKLQKPNLTKHVNINFSQCYLSYYFTRLIAVSKLKL